MLKYALALLASNRLGREFLPRKYTSLLRTFVNCGLKSFAAGVNVIKLFTVVSYEFL